MDNSSCCTCDLLRIRIQIRVQIQQRLRLLKVSIDPENLMLNSLDVYVSISDSDFVLLHMFDPNLLWLLLAFVGVIQPSDVS